MKQTKMSKKQLGSDDIEKFVTASKINLKPIAISLMESQAY